MGGVEAIRGMNYQHCLAILAALTVAEDSSLSGIRVEGLHDILDLEIYGEPTEAAHEHTLRHAVQAKSRSSGRSWTSSELVQIIKLWLPIADETDATFEIRTDGPLGQSATKLKLALSDASIGNYKEISDILSIDPSHPHCKATSRVSILSEPSSVEGLMDNAIREVLARLPGASRNLDSAGKAKDRVDALFREFAIRSGNPDAKERLVTRQEIVNILGGVMDLDRADHWALSLRDEYLRSLRTHSKTINRPSELLDQSSNTRVTLEELEDETSAVIISGLAGSGKSTLVDFWKLTATQRDQCIIRVQAEAYVPDGLDRLIANEIGDYVKRGLPRIVGQHMLSDPQSILVIDGVSEVPSDIRFELSKELRSHLSARLHARVFLLGRREDVCSSMLPTFSNPRPLMILPIDHEMRASIVAQILETSEGLLGDGPPEIRSGNPTPPSEHTSNQSDENCRRVLAQVERALGDASQNPMLLTMGAELVVSGVDFKNSAEIYEKTVGRMGERSHAADIDVASAALGIVYNQLLNEERRYADQIEWGRLLLAACSRLSELGLSVDAKAASEALRRSGLVEAATISEGARKLVLPIHDSFADYFAARALADGLVGVPDKLSNNDEQRILLFAQMGHTEASDVTTFVKDLPLLLPRLSAVSDIPLDEHSAKLIGELLRLVLPEHSSMPVTVWHVEGVYIAQAGGSRSGFLWDPSEYPQMTDAFTVIGDPGEGVLSFSARLWRMILRKALYAPGELEPQVPHASSEVLKRLEAHTELTALEVRRLLDEVCPPVARVQLDSAIGPQGMKGIIHFQNSDFHMSHGWHISYHAHTEFDVIAASEDSEEGEYLSRTTVRTVLSSTPTQTACSKIRRAMNVSTFPNWL